MAETPLGAALVRANNRALIRLGAVTAAVVLALWDRLRAYNRADAEEFIARVTPVVLAAREQAGNLAAAFVEAYVRAETGQPDRISTELPPIRAGVPVDEVYHRPFVTIWAALSAGVPYLDAVNAGRVRAESTAQMDVALASRAGSQAAMEASPYVVGYRRVLNGVSCELCTVASHQTYHSEDLMPIHQRCSCTVEPIIGDRPPRITREPSEVEAVEHGELGPLLIPAGQSFTGPADF